VIQIAVLGAGAGGLSCAVELTQRGHRVRLWNRNPATVAVFRSGVIGYAGVLGEGSVTVDRVTTDLAEALAGADVAVVCLPALAHDALFADLAGLGCAVPVLLNPGHTGGALHLRQVFAARGVPLPPVAELSTLTYVARRREDLVRITGRAGRVRCGALPGGSAACAAAAELFPGVVSAVPDVLASSLANVNLVLHPPGAILGAAWVESTGGAFTFYVDAMTDGTGRVIDVLDAERRAVAAGFGHDLPSLTSEMALIGTVPPDLAGPGDTVRPVSTAAAIRAGEANKSIGAPDSLAHRYYREDFPYAVRPFQVLARIAEVPTPLADALATVASALLGPGAIGCGLDANGRGLDANGRGLDANGLDADGLGIAGLDRDGLLELVRR
jgi:opine dehydrogenase